MATMLDVGNMMKGLHKERIVNGHIAGAEEISTPT